MRVRVTCKQVLDQPPPFTLVTLVGRAWGKRFIALSGEERIVYNQNLTYVEEESTRHKRKGEGDDD